jgi:hypothetical protein
MQSTENPKITQKKRSFTNSCPFKTFLFELRHATGIAQTCTCAMNGLCVAGSGPGRVVVGEEIWRDGDTFLRLISGLFWPIRFCPQVEICDVETEELARGKRVRVEGENVWGR